MSLPELREKIDAFRKLDFKTITYTALSTAIIETLSTRKNGTSLLARFSNTGKYSKTTRFYRIRKIHADDYRIPPDVMKAESDAWNPPIEHCKTGRLNREGESLLYTSPSSPAVAVGEMRIVDNERFALIVYEAVQDINVSMIGGSSFPPNSNVSDDDKLKLDIINDFLTHEFIRDVGVGTEYLYKISETIAKDHFDLPPSIQDAWCYPSVANKKMFNVCFRPEKAKEKLKLIGSQLCTCEQNNNSTLFHVKCIGICLPGGFFEYHPIGSPIQRSIFSEIKELQRP